MHIRAGVCDIYVCRYVCVWRSEHSLICHSLRHVHLASGNESLLGLDLADLVRLVSPRNLPLLPISIMSIL